MSTYRVRATDILLDADNSASVSWVGLGLDATVGAESSDVIQITYQLQSQGGQSVALQWSGKVSILDANAEPYADATAFEADVSTGSALTNGTRPVVAVQSDASGTLVVDITDVATGSGSSVVVEMIPEGVAGYSLQGITFD
jgi:hypothetical protein